MIEISSLERKIKKKVKMNKLDPNIYINFKLDFKIDDLNIQKK